MDIVASSVIEGGEAPDRIQCLREAAYDICGSGFKNIDKVSLSAIEIDVFGNMAVLAESVSIDDIQKFDVSFRGRWITVFRPVQMKWKDRTPSGEYWAETFIRRMVSDRGETGVYKILELGTIEEYNFSDAVKLRLEEQGISIYGRNRKRPSLTPDKVLKSSGNTAETCATGERLSPDEAAYRFIEAGLRYFQKRNGATARGIITSAIGRNNLAEIPDVSRLAELLSLGLEDGEEWRELQQGFDKMKRPIGRLSTGEPLGTYPEKRYKDALVRLAEYFYAWTRYLKSFGTAIEMKYATRPGFQATLDALASDDFRLLLSKVASDAIPEDFDALLSRSIIGAGYSGKPVHNVPDDDRGFDGIFQLMDNEQSPIQSSSSPTEIFFNGKDVGAEMNGILEEMYSKLDVREQASFGAFLFDVDKSGLPWYNRRWGISAFVSDECEFPYMGIKSKPVLVTMDILPGNRRQLSEEVQDAICCLGVSGLFRGCGYVIAMAYGRNLTNAAFDDAVRAFLEAGVEHVYDFGERYPNIVNPRELPICRRQIGSAILEDTGNIPEDLNRLLCGYLARCREVQLCLHIFQTFQTDIFSSLSRTIQQLSTIIEKLSSGRLEITPDDFPSSGEMRLYRNFRWNIFDQQHPASLEARPDPFGEAAELLSLWSRALRQCGLKCSRGFPSGIDAGLFERLNEVIGFDSIAEGHWMGLSEEELFPSDDKNRFA